MIIVHLGSNNDLLLDPKPYLLNPHLFDPNPLFLSVANRIGHITYSYNLAIFYSVICELELNYLRKKNVKKKKG